LSPSAGVSRPPPCRLLALAKGVPLPLGEANRTENCACADMPERENGRRLAKSPAPACRVHRERTASRRKWRWPVGLLRVVCQARAKCKRHDTSCMSRRHPDAVLENLLETETQRAVNVTHSDLPGRGICLAGVRENTGSLPVIVVEVSRPKRAKAIGRRPVSGGRDFLYSPPVCGWRLRPTDDLPSAEMRRNLFPCPNAC
jgi:hypothetical protein